MICAIFIGGKTHRAIPPRTKPFSIQPFDGVVLWLHRASAWITTRAKTARAASRNLLNSLQQKADYNAQISALATIALRAGSGTALLDGPQPGPLDIAGLVVAGVIFVSGWLLLSSRSSNIVHVNTTELTEQIRQKLKNIREEELDDRTLEGARIEREGGDVGHQHPEGRPWDHVKKVRQGINGLENLRRRIEAKLRHHAQHDPAGLSQEEKQELEAVLGEINELLRKAKEAIGQDSSTDEGTSNDAQ